MSKETASILKQVSSKSLPKLTKKQKAFAKEYLETGNGRQSALKVYDTTDPNTAAVIASENINKPNIQAYLESKAEKAAEFVYQLAESAQNEGVRLGASKDILDRAGYKPIERSVSVSASFEVTIEERARLERAATHSLQQLDG